MIFSRITRLDLCVCREAPDNFGPRTMGCGVLFLRKEGAGGLPPSKCWAGVRVCLQLLEYEPRSGRQVPLLLKMKRSPLALSKAIESGDTDLGKGAALPMSRGCADRAPVPAAFLWATCPGSLASPPSSSPCMSLQSTRSSCT